MKYYSTNHTAPEVTLGEAVVRGLAPDKGLYMPEQIEKLPRSFYDGIASMSFHEIACRVAEAFFGDDIEHETLRKIVCDTLSFETPVVRVEPGIYSLELFHGPTLAFKDVGARFMARMLSHFIGRDNGRVSVLVATSGDTGSAVANGFLGVEGIDVVVLYPKGKVSEIRLTSANSINVARFLPQAFYYFNAYAQMRRAGENGEIVVSVPSGNFGNITAGLFAKRMGLPVKRFIAANNSNDIFLQYLITGVYTPRPSVATLANAMDVGDPSNFVRVLDLYGQSIDAIRADISGARYSDDRIRSILADTLKRTGYLLDPHGACGYQALKEGLQAGETGVFLETAHPAKFKDTVEPIIGQPVAVPQRLAEFMKGQKLSVRLPSDFDTFKRFLSDRQ